MLVDKEAFVPGHAPARTATLKFTKRVLQMDYRYGQSCPIYHALRKAGVSVSSVGVWHWHDRVFNTHRFGRDLQRVSWILAQTNSAWLRPLRQLLLRDKELIVKL
jgi:hypothetical protein